MYKRVIIAGFMAGLLLVIWTFVVNGIFGFKHRMEMKKVLNEVQVYEILKANIPEPGKYVCNPQVIPEQGFPGGEPVFGIHYSGLGHEAAGRLMWFGLILYFIPPIIGAWMLSQTSSTTLASYPRKVLFFTCIGFLFAFFTDLDSHGIGEYPLGDSLILGLHSIVVWTLMGLVVAWRIKPMDRDLSAEEEDH
jgi:hypothetical protein